MGTTHFSGPVYSAAGFITGPDAYVPVTSGNVNLSPADNGKTTQIAFAGPSTVTLPAASAENIGLQYSVQCSSVTPVTGLKIRTVTSTPGDKFLGGSYSAASGGSNTLFIPNGTTNDVMNIGGATGGVAGTLLTFNCTAVNIWTVSGNIITTGAPSTPYADA